MGSSIDIKFIREHFGENESSALELWANSDDHHYRIYKLGSVGIGWSHYKPIDSSEEERIIASSSWGSWDYVLLVYDRGKVVNVDNLWENSHLRKKKGLLGSLLNSLFGKGGEQVGKKATNEEIRICNICNRSKRSRMWVKCFGGHLVCDDCRPRKDPLCPICGQLLYILE